MFAAFLLVFLAQAFHGLSASVAQDVQISGQLERSQVFEGESVGYQVMVSNDDDPPEPDLTHFEGFEVRLLGQQSQNSQSTVIINGVREDTHRFGKLFQYSLTPKKTGTLTVPAPKVVIDGEEFTGDTATLTVKQASDQESVFLETTVEPQIVFPTQKFTVTLQVDVRKLTGVLGERSPLSIQEPVQLTIPWLQVDAIPNATEERPPNEVLQPLLSGRGIQDGFAINGFTLGTRSFFALARAARFVPPSKEVVRTLKDGSTAQFLRYTIQRTFQAEQAGGIGIPAASIKGNFAIPDSDPIEGETLFAVGNSTSLEVAEIPTEGRPNDYCGGIGTFEIEATASPAAVTVGEPMTLAVYVTGKGTMDLIVAPDLNRLDNIASRFHIGEPTSSPVGEGRMFKYTITPKTRNTIEIPPIAMSYFNVQKGEYVTMKSEPVPVLIRPSTKRSPGSMNDATSGPVTQNDGSNTTAPDVLSQDDAVKTNADASTFRLLPNESTLSPPVTDWLTWKQWSLFWGLMIGGAAFARVFLTSGGKQTSDSQVHRRRLAKKNAQVALRTAEEAARAGSIASESLSRIIISLIAEATGQEARQMTSSEAVATMAGLGLSADFQNQTSDFFQQCESARYEESNETQRDLLNQCRDVITVLSREIK